VLLIGRSWIKTNFQIVLGKKFLLLQAILRTLLILTKKVKKEKFQKGVQMGFRPIGAITTTLIG
jgi:hypothetical protein